MALSPQKFREIVFQLLYSRDFTSEDEGEMSDFMMKQLSVTKKSMREAQAECERIYLLLSEIEECIRRFCVSYNLERIGLVEKNILRLGVYELCYSKQVPPKVAVAEAIRLTRKFSTPESGSFVNAVLDAILQERLSQSVEDNALIAAD